MKLSHYFLPYLAFLGIRTVANYFPGGLYWGYVIGYTSAALLLWIFRHKYQELQEGKISFSNILWALVVGLIGIVIWILPYHFISNFAQTDGIFGLITGQRKAANPYLLPRGLFFPFVLFRFIGYIFIVPIFEELFIRSFLWRYLIDSEIQSVPLGKYTTLAFWGTALLFSFSHNEWIVAFVYAVILNFFLVIKKDIRLCMIAHGTSNACLMGYVWMSGKWFLW